MLNKQDVIKILKDLDLPKEEYWVVAGSALVMHDIKKETRDVDLGCTSYLIDLLISKGHTPIVEDNNTRIIKINGDIEIFENWNVDKIEYIDKIPVGTIESIRKQKLELGREKDLIDIKLIDKFISKN